MLRLVPVVALLVLIGPVVAGVLGALLPAFGYLPALSGTGLSLQPFRALAELPGTARSAALSLLTGLATTAISFAIVMAFVAGWRGTRVFQLIERLTSPLLSVPHAAAAFGLAFLIAPSGFLARLLSPWATGWTRPPDALIIHDPLGIAMTAGLVAKEIPFLLLVTLAALPQSRAAERAGLAASLGYGRITGFGLAVLPSLYRQIRLPVFAVLAYATSVVDVALILGPTTPPPLAVRVLELQSDPDLAMRFVAAAAAVLQLLVTLSALFVWLVGERIAAALYRASARSGRRGLSGDSAIRVAAALLMALSAASIAAGLTLLSLWSVAGLWQFTDPLPQSFTLATWRRVLPDLLATIGNSIAVGVLATLIALALAIGALEREARAGLTFSTRALAALYAPLLVPQVAFLFGLELLAVGAGAEGTLIALTLAHLVFVFPYVFLSLGDPWRNWDARHGIVARSLGHGADAVFWRVRLPMLLRPALTAAAVGFAVSVGLYLPTLLIGAGRWPTLTTEAVALSAGSDRRVIGVVASLQALLPAAGFAIALLAPAWFFRHRRDMRASA